uniref:Putative prunasin hydrolase isoform PH-L1 n=2 Tax=Prunus serotina TaxID=23207 RepID=Q9M5X4_PRUSE|nr:putative prunasin hydrolase isoform PH-L1 precursor [Prunus serotina]
MQMQFRSSLLCVLLLLLGFALANTNAARTDPPVVCATLDRTNFDTLVPGFTFGTATAAYQLEGAANIDGRGPSVWDAFTHNHPEKITDGSNGDVAIDQYHRYKEDVAIMKDMGLDAYRFSISWSRLLPDGTLSGGINQKGIEYYNNLINELKSNDIEPLVTLFHWDVPQALEEKYGGVLSPRIVDDFKAYAGLCYKEFGDRVKHWTTLNEPYTISNHGYTIGIHAPGRCSSWYDPTCLGGDSGTEPYLVTHNLLPAHAAAVELYREKYQVSQKGVIGITVVSHWFEPASESQKDIKASFQALDFMYGWFMDPLTRGDYPQSMRSLVKERLPNFTEEQSKSLIGSYDYIGVNYYSSRYASTYPDDYSPSTPPSYLTDVHVNVTTELNGVPIGPQAASEWLYIYPKGLYDLVLYTQKKYNDPIMYITENGMDEFNNPKVSLERALDDSNRIDYYYRHLCYLQQAIIEGANVQGYFAWSLLDNFEWSEGYTVRFGINYVDYDNGLKRHSKLSTHWFKSFLKGSSTSKEKIRKFGNNNARARKFVYRI